MSEKRFVCPHCDQHYAADAAWQEEPMVCTACGRAFHPEAQVSPGTESDIDGGAARAPEQSPEPADVSAPAASGQPITEAFAGQTQPGVGVGGRIAAGALGVSTPLLLLGAMAVVAPWTHFFALLACPLVGYFLSVALCKGVLAFGGPSRFKPYVNGTRVGFLVWSVGPPVAAMFAIRDDDGGSGFFLVPIAGLWLLASGTAFVGWAIAAKRCWLVSAGSCK